MAGIVQAVRSSSDAQILKILAPEVRAWFKTEFKTFTPPQRYAVKEIHEGKNVLISSPTGSGKTLSAFLASVSELLLLAKKGTLEDTIYVVYVSPLKALGNDIRRNLEEPLKGIHELAEKGGKPLPRIRIGVRTGDTSQKERQEQSRRPPHILITTPESLAILLAAPKLGLALQHARWVIVDEIHSLADNKRGVHLSLTLERLHARCRRPPVRIGLSATIHPLDEVAKFLVGLEDGHPRDCLVVDVSFEKKTDIAVVSPVKDLVYTPGDDSSTALYKLLDKLIQQHATTLVFTNTRSATERVVFQLKKRFGKRYVEAIGAHHGSLSKDERLEVEEKLKRGALKCVVCSTSLELGIDIGSIDLVALLGSPKSISRALQRIGRSGHRLHDTSKGRIVVLDRDDLVECAVLAREARKRSLDRIQIPQNPLDVLAQHVLGLSLEQRWEEKDALALVRRAYPYRELSESDFTSLLTYLAGESTELEARRVYGKIWYDSRSKQFGRRGKMSRPIYYLNTGTIPDDVAVRVVTTAGRWVGKLEEDFVEELKPGDIFVLGGNTYGFRTTLGGKAIVEPRPGMHPTIPAWFSEQLPLSWDLAGEIRKFRGAMAARAGSEPPPATVKWLTSELAIDRTTATAIHGYFDEQRRFSLIPTDEELLVEEWSDEEGTINYAFHTLVGRRANDALSRAFARVVTKYLGVNCRVSINDNGFVLTYPKREYRRPERGLLKESVIRDMFNAAELEREVMSALENSEILKRRFRHVATRMLLILRNYLGHEMGAHRQQRYANTLFRVVRSLGREFPALKEVYREVLEDAMDLPHAKEFVARVERGDVKLVITRGASLPSPFAFNLAAVGGQDVVLMEDRKAMIRAMHARMMKVLEEREGKAATTERRS